MLHTKIKWTIITYLGWIGEICLLSFPFILLWANFQYGLPYYITLSYVISFLVCFSPKIYMVRQIRAAEKKLALVQKQAAEQAASQIFGYITCPHGHYLPAQICDVCTSQAMTKIEEAMNQRQGKIIH